MKHKLLSILLSLATVASLYSCGDKEDEPSLPNVNPDTENPSTGNPSTPSNTPDIKQIIQQNVTVKATYSDYMWTFQIESTLHNALPNDNIAFGIGHGDVNGTTVVSIENQAYKYTSRYNGNKKIMEFKNPFWFYYVFGMEQSEYSKNCWTECEMYYASYNALRNETQLSQDQKNLLQSLKRYLNEYESDANLFYKPSIQVLINNKYYTVATYKR